jgi:hypothetical protein
MANTKTTNSAKVTVSELDPNVILRPADNDLFVQTGKQVIDACKLNISIELWSHEIAGLIAHVLDWTKKYAGRIQSIYLAPRSTKMSLFVCPASDTFDFDLADDLTTLNTLLLKTFNVGMVEILQVPSDEIERFVDEGRAKLLYGGQAEPHQSVEA